MKYLPSSWSISWRCSRSFISVSLSHLILPSGDRDLLQRRGSFIIRQLCALLTSEKIMRSIAGLLCAVLLVATHTLQPS